ncbi:hypothetical protein JKP88DRAFT_254409 [Tribonema minus]|uniref:EF-hand domain-containing protein n=1 Tax=Tribonema minus TaxID=303371 RepID=A0A836CIF7_9STRA|nr:hypothetical protein JKP88DRAFT_254409 [Tribonema minus]
MSTARRESGGRSVKSGAAAALGIVTPQQFTAETPALTPSTVASDASAGDFGTEIKKGRSFRNLLSRHRSTKSHGADLSSTFGSVDEGVAAKKVKKGKLSLRLGRSSSRKGSSNHGEPGLAATSSFMAVTTGGDKRYDAFAAQSEWDPFDPPPPPPPPPLQLPPSAAAIHALETQEADAEIAPPPAPAPILSSSSVYVPAPQGLPVDSVSGSGAVAVAEHCIPAHLMPRPPPPDHRDSARNAVAAEGAVAAAAAGTVTAGVSAQTAGDGADDAQNAGFHNDPNSSCAAAHSSDGAPGPPPPNLNLKSRSPHSQKLLASSRQRAASPPQQPSAREALVRRAAHVDAERAKLSRGSRRILARKLKRAAAAAFRAADPSRRGFIDMAGLDQVLVATHVLHGTMPPHARGALLQLAWNVLAENVPVRHCGGGGAGDSDCCGNAGGSCSGGPSGGDCGSDQLSADEGGSSAQGVRSAPLTNLLMHAVYGNPEEAGHEVSSSAGSPLRQHYTTAAAAAGGGGGHLYDDDGSATSTIGETAAAVAAAAAAKAAARAVVRQKDVEAAWRQQRARQEEMQRRLEAARKAKEDAELAQLTFKPKTNTNSAALVARRASRTGANAAQAKRIAALLSEQLGSSSAAAAARMHKSTADLEFERCTFRPALPGRSVELSAARAAAAARGSSGGGGGGGTPAEATAARRNTWCATVDRARAGRVRRLQEYQAARDLDLRPGPLPQGMAEAFLSEGLALPGEGVGQGAPVADSTAWVPFKMALDERVERRRVAQAHRAAQQDAHAAAEAAQRARRRAALAHARRRAAAQSSLEAQVAARGGALPSLVVEIRTRRGGGIGGEGGGADSEPPEQGRAYVPLWADSSALTTAAGLAREHRLDDETTLALAHTLHQELQAALHQQQERSGGGGVSGGGGDFSGNGGGGGGAEVPTVVLRMALP